MSIFDRFRKKGTTSNSDATDPAIRKRLVDLVLAILRDADGRIRAEDAISAAAIIVGERCIDAAGDFPLRDHDLVPGSRVFSTTANVLIAGDVSDGGLQAIPKDSLVGILRGHLPTTAFRDDEFPALDDVFKQYAARIGKESDWGKVPLSIEEDNHPFLPPLRVGYETRTRVDELFSEIQQDKTRCLRIATEALADILLMVATVIDHKVALRLAIETINGMAKTAPMTEKAMRQVAAQQ